MSEPVFVHVEVDEGAASADGVSLRFKTVAGEGMRSIDRVRYESEDGTAGLWSVFAVDDEAGDVRRAASAARVEDSSAGTALLIVGGRQGLVLVHVDSGREVVEPYLVLAEDTALE